MTNTIQKLREIFTLKIIIEFIAIALTMALSLYVICDNVIFSEDMTDPIPLGLLIGAVSLAVLLFSGLIVFEMVKNKYRPNIIFTSILGVLFVIQLITILTFKNGQTYSVVITDGSTYSFEYSMETLDYVKDIFSFLLVLLVCFLIIDFIPKVVPNYDSVIFTIVIAFSLLNLASVIYSLTTEFDKIVGLFHMESFSELPSLALHSFYPSKNTYGIFMICSLLGLIYVAIRHYRHIWLALMIVLQIPIFLSQCKIAMGISVGLLIGFGIIRFLQTYKDNKQRNWIVLASIIGGILLINVILLAIPKTAETIKGLIENIFQEKFGKSTMDARYKIWEYCLIEMSYFNRFSGAGYRIFNAILGKYNCADVAYYVTFDTDSAHSTYFELLGNGGISFLLIWIAIFSYGIYLITKVFKDDKWLSTFSILVVFTILVLSFLEGGVVIFPQTGEYLFLTMLLFIPLLTTKNKTTLRLFY